LMGFLCLGGGVLLKAVSHLECRSDRAQH
jgi:hypothetical protein